MKRYKKTQYYVTENGDVYRKGKDGQFRKRKPQMVNNFLQLKIFNQFYDEFVYVHHMVAHCYISNPEGYSYVLHLDKNRTNNNVSNLRWTDKYQSKMKKNKFTQEQIEFMVSNYLEKGHTQIELSEMFGVKQGYISYLIKRYREGKLKFHSS